MPVFFQQYSRNSIDILSILANKISSQINLTRSYSKSPICTINIIAIDNLDGRNTAKIPLS